MEKKNGFTLIELLAVIVILAIILAIAIPSITNVINNVQIDAYVKNEKMLLKAARTYVGINDITLPTNIGDTMEVTLSTLQSGNFITPIKDPIDKSTTCNGYVIITKIDNSNYDYSPHLNCANNIGSASADGLVAHYKFDDFQESTDNLANTTAARLLSFHNQGGYLHAGLGSSLAPEKGPNWYKFQISKIGTNHRIAQFPYIDQLNNETKTYSIEYDFGTTTGYYWRIDGSSGGDSSIVENGKWIGVKANTSGSVNTEAIFLDNDNINQNVNDTIYYRYYQVEKKDHYTPFTETTRTSIVKDYSGSNNSASLASTTTPKWVSNGKVGSGAYEFNGTSQYIQVNHNNSLNNNVITIAAWLKPDALPAATHQRLIAKNDAAGYILNLYGPKIESYMGGQLISGPNISVGVWTHAVVTIDETRLKFYINGSLYSDVTYTGTVNGSTAPMTIGGVVGSAYFDGMLDDIRIYKRTLTANEIKQLYNTQQNGGN